MTSTPRQNGQHCISYLWIGRKTVAVQRMSERYYNAKLLKSVARFAELPLDHGSEVAFAGRSNSGKSSAINRICNHKNLARTSKTPGRTQLLNFFCIDDRHRLVDLPGYGYAKVADHVRRHWQQLIRQYLAHRVSLKGIMLMMDIRHPLTQSDQLLLDWCLESELRCHILLTKSDKLRRGAVIASMQQVHNQLSQFDGVSIQAFSAKTGVGIRECQQTLDEWLFA